jgi:ABC-type antimicrobial peptide transport system permease subunit
MGLGLGEEATAIFVELVVPFVLGALIGLVAAVVIVHLAIGHLDTLRNLQPPARVVVDLASMGEALLVGVVALLALAGIGTIAVARVRPMEAMRSAD